MGKTYEQLLKLSRIEDVLRAFITIPYEEFLLVFNYALERTVSPRENKCIWESYIEEKSLKEIGAELGVTRERVRQIIAKGMRRVKSWNDKTQMLNMGLEWYIDNEIFNAVEKEKKKYEIEQTTPILNRQIEVLNLSTRTRNCLKRANINTVGELSKLTTVELYKIRNMGKNSVNEIVEKLKKHDIEIV